MAGDWIKFELATLDKPEVCLLADMAGIDPDAVVGKLIRVWGWFDQHTAEGNAPSVSKKLLDRLVGVTGFCEHMKSVGWMVEEEGSISLPHFERHNGQTAKKRATTARRVEKHKKGNGKGNADGVSGALAGALPREEKIKNKDPLSPREPVDPRMPSEMTLSWEPDEKLLKAYAVHQGLTLDLFTDAVVKAFTGYYEPRGQMNTQAEWVSMLVKWVQNDKARAAAASNVRPFPARAASASPDFDDTGWADDLGGAL